MIHSMNSAVNEFENRFSSGEIMSYPKSIHKLWKTWNELNGWCVEKLSGPRKTMW